MQQPMAAAPHSSPQSSAPALAAATPTAPPTPASVQQELQRRGLSAAAGWNAPPPREPEEEEGPWVHPWPILSAPDSPTEGGGDEGERWGGKEEEDEEGEGGSSSVKEMMGELRLRILTERLRLLGSQRELAALRCERFTEMLEATLVHAQRQQQQGVPLRGEPSGGDGEGVEERGVLGAERLSSWYPQDHPSRGVPSAAGRRRSLDDWPGMGAPSTLATRLRRRRIQEQRRKSFGSS